MACQMFGQLELLGAATYFRRKTLEGKVREYSV